MCANYIFIESTLCYFKERDSVRGIGLLILN